MAVSIELTDEERGYVARVAGMKPGFLPTLLSYLPYFAPVALFGFYGVAIGDLTAVVLAFLCLLGLNLWWIHGQSGPTALFLAICTKIIAASKAQEQPPQ
ncbi:hypothetical protein FQV39_14145 [Bosea sp. F3-2]|uniref:hypothetical protein n=1 Tax=Bosea sp. F3-2 TaxID=2599640 RepID=UPI0011EE5FEF|nr:hypothetical protein [Bosea sp. F3-2]QEL23596.1 hypothetical protein FQV39_14145 [Bosea sp. F3-2]